MSEADRGVSTSHIQSIDNSMNIKTLITFILDVTDSVA
jgi:hypothetical protein